MEKIQHLFCRGEQREYFVRTGTEGEHAPHQIGIQVVGAVSAAIGAVPCLLRHALPHPQLAEREVVKTDHGILFAEPWQVF